jgi:hypothetical protein
MTRQLNTDAVPDQTVRGRVTDSQGASCHGAVVEVEGVDFGDGRRRWGGNNQSDPLAVTNEAGEFVLTTRESVTALMARVTARGHASRNVRLELGKNITVTLDEGATLTGRVLLDGKPVPNVAVGVSGQDRAAGTFAGHFDVGTDATGRFTLTNLPAKTDYYLYGLMSTVGAHGAIAIRPVHVGRNGSKTDVGDLLIKPSYRLSGRVVLADGGKIPPNTRLLIGRRQAWDSSDVMLESDGVFTVTGLPAEAVTLSLRMPGYQFSSKNRSYDPLNRRLTGKIGGDISGMELLLEPATPASRVTRASMPSPPTRDERPENLPLRGAEEK